MKIPKRLVLAALIFAGLFLFYKKNYEIPVLMYHHVGSTEDTSSTNVSTKAFERQMEFLKIHQFKVVSVEHIFDLIKSGKKIPDKIIAITFDDGYLDNFENAFPVLKKMNFPATVFMIVENINKPGWLSAEDLKIMDESGVAIGSHTVHHVYLPDATPEVAQNEIEESKKALERILNHPVFTFSYPAGGFSESIREMVVNAGYKGAVTTNRGLRKHDAYALHRIKIPDANGDLFNFWLKVSGVARAGKKKIEVE